MDRVGKHGDRSAELHREHRFVDRLRCRGPADERADDDLVLAIDDDRDVALRLAHVAFGARRKVRGLLIRVDAAVLRLIQKETDRGGLGIGVYGARRRAEIRADAVAERDLHRGLALVVAEMGRQLVTDAVADRVDVIGGSKGVVDFQVVPAVVGNARGVEAETGEGRRCGAANVELDDRGLDRRSVRELHNVLTALSRARPYALRPRVLADVDARRAERLREQRGAARMVARVDLPRADQGRAHAEARVDLRELGSRRSGTEDRDALGQVAEARTFFVRPEARLGETLELRDFPDRADRDDDVARLELARAVIGPHDHLAGCADLRRTAHRNSTCGLVALDAICVWWAGGRLAVVLDREDLNFAYGTPKRGGGSRTERAAEGCPAGRYLISCCFFSHAAATTLLSALSTATCLFMSFSSAWVSFALIESSSRASVPSSLLNKAFRTTGAMLSASCRCLSSSRSTKLLATMLGSLVKSSPTSICLPSSA